MCTTTEEKKRVFDESHIMPTQEENASVIKRCKLDLSGTTTKDDIYLTISMSLVQSMVADLLPANKSQKSMLSTMLLLSLPVRSAAGKDKILDNFDDVVLLPWCSASDVKKYHCKEYVDIILDDRFNSRCGNTFKHLEPFLGELNKSQMYFNKLDERFQDQESDDELFKIAVDSGNLLKYLQDEYLYEPKIQDQQLLDTSEHDSADDESTDAHILETHVREFIKNDNAKLIHGYPKSRLSKHNLMYDCPLFPLLPIYCQLVTGATLSVVENLLKNKSHNGVGINLDGGRHHAFKNKGNGFCYINDIVLAINKFRMKNYQRISYVDFDLHHGDGVEKAFSTSKNVQTISLHFAEYGFFPNSGSEEKHDTANQCHSFLFPRGTTDEEYIHKVKSDVLAHMHGFDPEVVVIQCGGDGLKNDDYDVWALSIKGLCQAIMSVVEEFGPHCKILVLGGGGYNVHLQARFYAYLVYKIVEFSKRQPGSNLLSEDYTFEIIPEHVFTEFYKPSFYKFSSRS